MGAESRNFQELGLRASLGLPHLREPWRSHSWEREGDGEGGRPMGLWPQEGPGAGELVNAA